MNFDDFGLSKAILQAVAKEGYTTPTPIQQQAIPHILKGVDLLGLAQTGTGKTAAFALPILHKLCMEKAPPPRGGARILVLAPTRELANQIADSFRAYSARMKLSIHAIYGGVSYGPQIKAIQRGLDILVATPGRLMDHLERRVINLKSVEVLVLDEVDQMLDLGFFRAIRRIVQELPLRRQNLFFSATLPDEIAVLARELLNDPMKVSVAPAATTVERVVQKVFYVERARKRDLLVNLMADVDLQRTIVFTRTKHGANKLEKQLATAGISAEAIHGNKSQSQREKTLLNFRSNKLRVLVATDIAARGIDIDGVSHVINFDLPEVPEAYVHRIGRTARAGNEGQAFSFCDFEERHLLRAIEKTIRLKLDAEDYRLEETKKLEAARDTKKDKPARRTRKTSAKNTSNKTSQFAALSKTESGFDPMRVPGEPQRDRTTRVTVRKRNGPRPEGHNQAYGDNDSLRRKPQQNKRGTEPSNKKNNFGPSKKKLSGSHKRHVAKA